jgi:hypothetical protein
MGDCDASGEDIHRNFIATTDCWDVVRRVALTAEQVRQYALPKLPGKTHADGTPSDSRAKGFIARHGDYFQVELDALDPNVLRALFTTALAEFWNEAAYKKALKREATKRRTLARP